MNGFARSAALHSLTFQAPNLKLEDVSCDVTGVGFCDVTELGQAHIHGIPSVSAKGLCEKKPGKWPMNSGKTQLTR